MKRWPVVAVAAAALVAGCGVVSIGSPVEGGFKSSEARVAPDPALTPFYEQQLQWDRCGLNYCTTLEVPIDYSDPAAGSMELALLKAPATGPRPRGPLVVNPGGPGGSGVDYAEAAGQVVTPELRRNFDIIGFDPRGVGKSDPLECMTGPQLDEFLAADASPDNGAEEQALVTDSEEFGAGCMSDSSELTANIGSASVVRDMDILRAALDQDQLDYLGFSYGTYLGAGYAEKYPQRVGRFVLDGAIDPSLDNTEISKGQALGFEVALQRYIDSCPQRPTCPLGADPAVAKQKIIDLLAAADAQPLRTDDQSRPLTESLLLSGIIYPLYSPSYGYDLLDTSLTLALAGDGSAMLDTLDIFNERNEDGSYQDNATDALYAVNCVDRPDRPTLAETAELARQWQQEAPVFGSYLAYGNLPCTYWPVPATDAPRVITADGSAPILVVGTEFDPATPYQWSQALASQLANGRLLTWRGGEGHTAYNNGSECINTTIDRFLIEGIVPENGTECS